MEGPLAVIRATLCLLRDDPSLILLLLFWRAFYPALKAIAWLI